MDSQSCRSVGYADSVESKSYFANCMSRNQTLHRGVFKL